MGYYIGELVRAVLDLEYFIFFEKFKNNFQKSIFKEKIENRGNFHKKSELEIFNFQDFFISFIILEKSKACALR